MRFLRHFFALFLISAALLLPLHDVSAANIFDQFETAAISLANDTVEVSFKVPPDWKAVTTAGDGTGCVIKLVGTSSPKSCWIFLGQVDQIDNHADWELFLKNCCQELCKCVYADQNCRMDNWQYGVMSGGQQQITVFSPDGTQQSAELNTFILGKMVLGVVVELEEPTNLDEEVTHITDCITFKKVE
jgi:hypothetical protein